MNKFLVAIHPGTNLKLSFCSFCLKVLNSGFSLISGFILASVAAAAAAEDFFDLLAFWGRSNRGWDWLWGIPPCWGLPESGTCCLCCGTGRLKVGT